MEGAKIFDFAAERKARGLDSKDALMQELTMLELERKRYDREFKDIRFRDLDPEIKARMKAMDSRHKEACLLLDPEDAAMSVRIAQEMFRAELIESNEVA